MKGIALIVMIFSLNVYADDYLIQEIEDLNSSLSIEDPAREKLTLRLADLYFDSSIKEMDGEEVIAKRERSLELYLDAHEGRNNLSKVKGQLKYKVEFQIARLLNKLQKNDKAIPYLKSVYLIENKDKKLRREAAFELADWFEKKNNFTYTNQYYLEAIKLCDTIDSCNYAHYRRGWLLYKETNLLEAIEELKLSMWDSKGQVREKVLKDYLMFVSNKQTDGKDELKELIKLSKKISKPMLIRETAESFFTAGNRIAGTTFLEYINNKNPSLYLSVRLLEENYGYRNWDNVNKYLRKLSHTKLLDVKKDEKNETKKILRRFIVQLDAETKENKTLNEHLISSIELYLTLFPVDELRTKMQEGWLSAQPDDEKKLNKLSDWINDSLEKKLSIENIEKFRQTRLSIAQKIKNGKIVIHEALELSKISKNESRKYKYIAARQMYEDKNFKLALPLFLALSNSAIESENIDKWAILSQNLSLDIYNNLKDFESLEKQANLWLNATHLHENKDLKKELLEMKKIATQARFEQAVVAKNSIFSLETFYNYCLKNIYPEKSCKNAKVLSIELKDQSKLITLLEKENDESTLIVEYELMGRFSDAAKLYEKNKIKKFSIETYLKTALLYELDLDFKNRDRILNLLVVRLKSQKTIPQNLEKTLFVTLDEANLLTSKTLSLPWSLSTKLKLAHRLEISSPSKITKKILLSQKQFVGPAWSRLILEKIIPIDEKQQKISFYGRNSKYKFKQRTNAIKKLADKIATYLDGANQELRIYLLNIAKSAYLKLSQEILNTPLPEGLDEETLSIVKNQLNEMALPFNNVANDYQRLLDAELIAIKDQELKDKIAIHLSDEKPDYVSYIKISPARSYNLSEINYSDATKWKNILKQRPEDVSSLQKLESFYKTNNSERIASYFTGRIKSLRN